MVGFWKRWGSVAGQLFGWTFAVFYCAIWIYAAYFGVFGELLKEFNYLHLLISGGADWRDIFQSLYKIASQVFAIAILSALAIFLAYCFIRGGDQKRRL